MILVNVHKCKRCGNEAVEYIEPCLGKTLNRCDNCGWENSRIPKENKHGFILSENYEVVMDKLKNDGYGILNLVYKNKTVETYSFKEKLSKTDINEYIEKLEDDRELILEKCFFSVWNDERGLEVLLGNLPMPSYTENLVS